MLEPTLMRDDGSLLSICCVRPLSPHTLGFASGWRDNPYKSPAKAIPLIPIRAQGQNRCTLFEKLALEYI